MKVVRIFLLVVGLAIIVNAQNQASTSEKSILSGMVLDEYGVGVPDAKLTFSDKTGKSAQAVTDNQGVFQTELSGGKYNIEVRRLGFVQYKLEDYKVANKSKMQLDFCLDVQAMSDYATILFDKPTKIRINKIRKSRKKINK